MSALLANGFRMAFSSQPDLANPIADWSDHSQEKKQNGSDDPSVDKQKNDAQSQFTEKDENGDDAIDSPIPLFEFDILISAFRTFHFSFLRILLIIQTNRNEVLLSFSAGNQTYGIGNKAKELADENKDNVHLIAPCWSSRTMRWPAPIAGFQ